MQTDHPQTVSKSAIAFFTGTSLSRVAGMLRDMVMAFSFGANPAVAAFMVAFRFSNIFRRLLGEGQMPAGFVPYFEQSRKNDPKKRRSFFSRSFFNSSPISCVAYCCSRDPALLRLFL